jgi:DNA mismatch repair protein MutS2
MDSKKVLLDQMISALQKEKGQFEKLNHNSRQTTKEAEEAKKRFEEAKAKFEERSKTQQEIIERNNKYLTSGKKMKQFIDRFQVGKQAKTANKKLVEEVVQFLAIEKSKILEAKEAERLKKEAEAASKQFKKPQKAAAKSTEIPLVVGSRVKLEGNKEVGTVMEISGQEVIVAYGIMRVKVALKKLVVVR